MQCEAFERRLQWLLDRRNRPEEDDGLREHASCCEPCGEFLNAQTQLFRSLTTDDPPELGGDFADRVIEAASAETPPRWTTKRIAWGIIATVAAALLLATLPFWPLESDEVPGPLVAHRPTAPAPSDPQATSVDPEEVGPLLQQLVQQLSDPTIKKLETVDQLSGGIRSLTSTINIAIDALRRNMPVNHEAMLEKPQADTARPAWFRQLS